MTSVKKSTRAFRVSNTTPTTNNEETVQMKRKHPRLISLTEDASKRQFHPFISTSFFLIFGGLYILAAMLPLITILLALFVYKGFMDENVITLILGLIILDLIVPLPGDGFKPGNILQSQTFGRLYSEGGANYFPAKSICHLTKDSLSREGTYILASWPHALIGGGNHFFFPIFYQMGYHPIYSSASVMKYIPFLRRFFSFVGSVDVSKSSLKRVLQVQKHQDNINASTESLSASSYPCNVVHLVVGGIGEMFYTPINAKDETIILSKRKGFIKLALETGADIIPSYTFGANQTYYRIFGPGSTLAKISSLLQVSILPWFGRWYIPMGFVPYKTPLMDVVGEVFHVPKLKEGEEVTKEMVDEVHKEFCTMMKKLFEDHKQTYVKEMNAPEEWLTKNLKFEDE